VHAILYEKLLAEFFIDKKEAVHYKGKLLRRCFRMSRKAVAI